MVFANRRYQRPPKRALVEADRNQQASNRQFAHDVVVARPLKRAGRFRYISDE